MARHQINSWSGGIDRDAASPFTVFDTEEVPIPVPSKNSGGSSSSSSSNDGPDLGKYADMWVEPANRTLPTPQNSTIWDKMQNLDEKLNTGFDNFIKSNPVTEFLARAGNSAADVMTGGQQIQDNYDTGSKLANGVADLLGVAGGMVENIPGTAINTGNALNTAVGKPAEDVLTRVSNRFGIPNTLEDAANSVANRFSQLANNTNNGLAKATINKLSQGTQYGLNNLPSYAIKGLSSGAELGAYNGTTNAINGRDVKQGIAEGMGQGMLLGMGGKALGDFTHVIKGIGKVKVLKDDGNKVMFQDENGKTQTMNKTIFDNTVQSLNTMNPIYDNTNWHNINPTENKIPTLDTNTPLENKVAQNKSIVDINRLQNTEGKTPIENEAATDKINNETNLNEIMNTDYNKVNDIDTLNKHISELQNSIKNTTDETKLKAMNLQLFAAQARLKNLSDVIRPNIQNPGSRIVSSNDKGKFSFKNSYNNFKNSINNAYTRLVDINKPTADFSKVSGDEAYIKSINSKNVGGVVDHILQNSLVDREGNKIGFSLKQLVKQIPKKKQDEFWEYMLHKHNVQRAAEGKNVYSDYDSQTSQNAVNEFERLNPDLKKAGDNITKWLNKFMGEWGNKSGLISDDLWEALKKQYPNYIPTNRSFTELESGMQQTNGKGFVDQTSPIKRATGSSRDIINPVENIMNLVNRTVRTAKYNEVGQEVLDSIRKDPNKLKNFAEIIPENSDARLDLDNVVTVFDKGERVHLRINNKPFLDSLKAINKSNVGDIEGTVKKATNLFKSLITTKNPLFALSNAARDLPTYLVNSKENNPLAAMWNLGGAYKDILTNGEAYKKYKAVGGGGSNFFNSEKPYKSAKDLTRRGLLPILNEGIEGFNNVFENAPRLAEFKRTLKKTGDVNKALYDSSEVTTNFARGGDITKHIDSFVPYLNAGVQSLDKLARQFKNRPIATILKGATTITAPTLLLNNYNQDNENYQKLDNRTKDNYYLIPNGDKFIKIPKTRELGVLFGSLAERIMRQRQGEADAFKGFGNTIATNFAPASPIENNIAAPLIYNLPSNKDFAGRNIVPQSMIQDERSPYLQYDEKTSEIAKKMGELTGYSPKKIDYIIGAYTGVVGQFLQPLTTESTKTGSKTGDLLSPLTSRFTADPLYNNQSLQDFYENMANVKRAAADNNIINNIDSKTTTHEERLSSEFTKANKDIADLTKASFQALQDGDMAKVKELRQKIIDTATSTNKYVPSAGQSNPDLPTPASEIQANVEGRLKGKRSTEATEIRKQIKSISKSDMSAEERTQRLNQLLDAAQNAPQKNPSKRK